MNQIDLAYSLPFEDKYGAHFVNIAGRCSQINAYRVTSEEADIIPLCLMEAKSLQPSCGANKLQLDTERVTIRDSEFNFKHVLGDRAKLAFFRIEEFSW